MSMYNDIVRRERGNTEKCITNSVAVANHARRFLRGRWSFLESGSEKKRYGTYSEKPDGKCDKTAERMMLNFAGSGHPFFMPPAPRKEETRRSKRERSLFTSTPVKKPWNWLFARFFFKSAQYLRSSSGFVQKNHQKIQRPQGNLHRMKIWNQWKYLQNFLLPFLTPTRSCRKPAARL